MAATYIRSSGEHVAERIRPVPDTAEERRLIVLADDPESQWSRVDEDEPEPEPAGPGGRPPQSAPVADWRAWAVAQGLDEAAAEATSKIALIEQYGKVVTPDDAQE